MGDRPLDLAVSIEAIGRAIEAGSEQRWRFCQTAHDAVKADASAPTGTELYIPSMTDEWPSELPARVNFREGTASIGGFNVELLQHATDNDAAFTVAQRLYRNRHQKIGNHSTGVTTTGAGGTITIVDDAGAAVTGLLDSVASRALIIERECIILTADNGSGNYDRTRGAFGTLIRAHSANAIDDVALFDAEHGPVLEDREIVLERNTVDADVGDATVLARGVIRGISSPSPERIRVEAASILELLESRTLGGDMWKSTTRAVPPFGSLVIRGADPGGDLPIHQNDAIDTNSHLMPMTDGKGSAWILNWIEASGEASAYPGSAGQQDIVQPFAGALPPDNWLKPAHEFITLHSSSPDLDAASTRFGSASVAGSVTVTNSLFVFFLQCLLTTPHGNNHTTYDLGNVNNPRIFSNIGLGVQSGHVDVTGIESLAAKFMEVGRTEHLHVGIKGAMDALDAFQAWFRVLGCVVAPTSNGKLGVIELDDVGPITQSTLVEADFIKPPVQRRRMEDTYDVLECTRYAAGDNGQPGLDTVVDTFKDVINLERLISGRHRSGKLDARIFGDAGFLRDVVIARHVQRYHKPIPEIAGELLRTQDHWPGTYLSVTHSKIWGRDGTRGVTTETMLVSERDHSAQGSSTKYKLLWVSGAYDRAGRYAPSSDVTGVLGVGTGTGGANRVPVDTDNYATAATAGDEITNDDTEAWSVNDEFQVLNPDLSVKHAGPFQITDVGTTTIDTPDSPGVAAGDILVPASWDNAVAAQKAKWSWIADVNDTLGAGSETPFQWVT